MTLLYWCNWRVMNLMLHKIIYVMTCHIGKSNTFIIIANEIINRPLLFDKIYNVSAIYAKLHIISHFTIINENKIMSIIKACFG